MMYTELFCFEGASATDAAPCRRQIRNKRKTGQTVSSHRRTAAKPFSEAGKDAVMAMLSRRAVRAR